MRSIISKYKTIPMQVKASFWFMVCGFLNQGVSLLTTPIFTRILTTSEYGQYSVFNSWLGLISVFVTLNLFAGVFTQGLIKYSEEKKQFASSLQGLCFTLVLVWIGLYSLMHNKFNAITELTTVQTLAMLVIIWSSAIFSFWSAEQRVALKYKLLVIITICVTILKPTVSIFLVLQSEDKVTARILGIAIVNLVFYTVFFLTDLCNGKQFFSKKFWAYSLRFNLPLIPHYLSLTVLASSDRIMISNIVGSAEAGIYNLAYALSQVMQIFSNAILQTIEPWLYKKIKDKSVTEIERIAFPTFVFIGGLNIALMLFAPEILWLFAPNSFSEAVWIIPPVALSVFFQFLYTFFAVFEFYYEKTKYIMAATTIGAVINIILNYVFINLFGYMAAGYTTLSCYILFALFHYVFMKRMCREFLNDVVVYNGKKLILVTAIICAASFIILTSYTSNVLRYSLIAASLLMILLIRKKLKEFMVEMLSIRKAR